MFHATKKDARVKKPPSKLRTHFDHTLEKMQRLGKSLMFPIAVLPIAALFLRIGVLIEDPLSNGSAGINHSQVFIGKLIAAPGKIIFDNLAIIFAIGIAFGFAKDNRGEAALVGAIVWLGMNLLISKGYLAEAIYQNALVHNFGTVDQPDNHTQLLYFFKNNKVEYQLDAGVFGGIFVGWVVSWLYNRYRNVKLPTSLSFFGGRRFIPMLGVLSVIPLGLFFAILWPWAQYALLKIGTGLSDSPEWGKGVATGTYAIINRLMQPFGLHHVINTFVWFQLPITGHQVASNALETVNGDINAFQKGILGSGLFTSGFFPLYLGGLPGAAFALIMTSDKNRRKQMFYFYSGTAFVAFLTGIDEPLVFSFIFVSPLLYFLNALMTGIIYAFVIYSQISLGFGFSAGLIDYIISAPSSWNMAKHAVTIMANPLWIWMYASIMFVMYYFVFMIVIKKRNIMTPGREPVNQVVSNIDAGPPDKRDKYLIMAENILKVIPKENIELIENCATRLRLTVKDNDVKVINDELIKQTGAKGIVRLGKKGYQIIIGTDVEHVADRMKEIIK